MSRITKQLWAVYEPDNNIPFSVATIEVLIKRNILSDIEDQLLFKYGEHYFLINKKTDWFSICKQYHALTQNLKTLISINEPDINCSCCHTHYTNVNGMTVIDKSRTNSEQEADKIFICENCYNKYNKKTWQEVWDDADEEDD